MQKRAGESIHREAPQESEASPNHFGLGVVTTAGSETMKDTSKKNFPQSVLE